MKRLISLLIATLLLFPIGAHATAIPQIGIEEATLVAIVGNEDIAAIPEPRTYNGIAEGDVIAGVATHYCPCTRCCDKSDGITASGFVVWRGMDDPYIVACNWLPFGSVVRINGIEYTVRDRGGDFGNVGRVDIFEPRGHREAYKRGKPDVVIEIVRIGEG